MYIFRFRQAFTLIEVLLGVTIISIVFLALSTLFVSSIRANTANLNSLTAYSLAQEGIELIRNARDSNWLQNYAWSGLENFNNEPIDFSRLNPVTQEYAYYLASVDFDSPSGLKIVKLEPENIDESTVLGYKQIILCKLTNPGLPSTVGMYYVNKFGNADDCSSTIFGLGITSVDSVYSRFIKIKRVADKKIEVISSVLWYEPWNRSGPMRRVDIRTDLTDWKGGPI